MKRLLAITIGGLWLLTAGLALAAPGDPLGGDDPGCVPDTKDHLKCSDGAMKAIGKAIAAVWKCHIKQADLAFKGTPTDDETCENGGPGSKSAKDKLDTALAKLGASGVCTGTNVIANAQMIETQVFADKNTSGSMDQQNGTVYCAPGTAIDPSGDDAGTVDTTSTNKKDMQKCADTVAKNLCKLVGAVTKCHVKVADKLFKNDTTFNEETCETGPLGGKSAEEKYNAAVGDPKIGAACTQACLTPEATRTALGSSQISALETYLQKLYPCPGPTTTTTTTSTTTTTIRSWSGRRSRTPTRSRAPPVKSGVRPTLLRTASATAAPTRTAAAPPARASSFRGSPRTGRSCRSRPAWRRPSRSRRRMLSPHVSIKPACRAGTPTQRPAPASRRASWRATPRGAYLAPRRAAAINPDSSSPCFS